MQQLYDVVIVGGGIAGNALASALAKGGRSTLVLERELVYRDKVRGENIMPWGVREVQRLGLESVLLEAGGHYATQLVPYDEVLSNKDAEVRAQRIAVLSPGVRGFLDVGHPQACEALSRTAERAGAHMVRGVRDIQVRALGDQPELTYSVDDKEVVVRARLIVGADGRSSTLRKQLGLVLQETVPRTVAAGLLVDSFDYPSDTISVGTTRDALFLVTPRSAGVARLYMIWNIADRHRFAGSDGATRFLEAYRGYSFPHAEQVGRAKPIGPCATYPMNDSYMDQPVVEGAVLIGDAAGWNDPVIGQGLSIALRDARTVADVVLNSPPPWPIKAFGAYVAERRERLRRLRLAAFIANEMRCTFTPDGTRRRRTWMDRMAREPWIAATALCPFVGPEVMPASAFEPSVVERLLALR